MRAPRGLRRRFLLGALASAAFAIVLFGAATFALVASDEDDAAESGDGDTQVAEAGELVLESMLLAAPVGAGAAFAIAALLARRTTRPIDDAIRAARETSAHDLSRRLGVPADEGELRDLVLALNELFARLDEGFGALARFAADASHELRTPLTVMGAELEVALQHERDAAQWKTVATGILADTRRLGATVDGLLSLARAGSDPPGSRRVVPILDVVDPVIAQLAASAEARGVTLAGPSEVAAAVDGNPVTLESAVRNLVENAIRHARHRVGVRIEVAPEGRSLRVIVDDDGAGLGDDPERLFLPLVRGAGADRGTGAGLGLAIARRVAEAHGGRLRSNASPSGGARLILSLPVA